VTETKRLRANPHYQPSRYQGGHETEVLKAASSINKAALTEAVRPRVSCLVSRVSCLVSPLSPLPTHRCRNSDCAERSIRGDSLGASAQHFDGSERQRAEEKCCARMNWTGKKPITVNFPERWHLIWLENGSGNQPGLYKQCVIN
jgi:hypothetical protein